MQKSNVRCPSCGEYEVIIICHDDENDCHSYCTNCDYGICELC